MNSIGKKVFDDLYLHISAIDLLASESHRDLIATAFTVIPSEVQADINVIKLNVRSGRISLLQYADFESNPFPVLLDSWVIEPHSEKPSFRTYRASLNPPILHRKELLVAENHPNREEWCRLTKEAETIGLFESSRTIGFQKNWTNQIAEKGYCIFAGRFTPIGNSFEVSDTSSENSFEKIQRHLTALNRASLSAPVQVLIKNGLLSSEHSFFDYGCGRGTDVKALKYAGIYADGWDPHYSPSSELKKADVVNLGFVVNVIEDPAERAEAFNKSFALAKKVLAVSVMLYGPEQPGKPFLDGYITSRNTFQKYFSQGELKDYLEHALEQQVYMVGPGIAIIFSDKDLEQKFNARRFKSNDFTERLLSARILRTKTDRQPKQRVHKTSRSEQQFLDAKEDLEKLWKLSLDFGRYPDPSEVNFLDVLIKKTQSYSRAIRLLRSHFDHSLLETASKERSDELLLYVSTLQFEKRPAYKKLEQSIQRDIKYFFNDYKTAQASALRLLINSADPSEILSACDEAVAQGIGWLDTNQSLQFHIDLLDRLPVVLRAYVNCGLILWESMSDVHIVKIHISSGKLTFLEFTEFENSPLPLLTKRIKINLRKQDLDIFEYGSELYPSTILYRKSRYMHEDMQGYPEQLAFDERLESLDILGLDNFGPSFQELQSLLDAKRLSINGFDLIPSQSIPNIDASCGANFKYRDFIECGETQQRLGLKNTPLNPETYNSLLSIANDVLDPVIDYFGAVQLTYGFSSAELTKNIGGRISPKLDQHAGHECNRIGKPICDRLGASVDFIVHDEDMLEVAQWVVMNCNFDRLYYYGQDRPIHVSVSSNPVREITIMQAASASVRKIPRTTTEDKFLALKSSD